MAKAVRVVSAMMIISIASVLLIIANWLELKLGYTFEKTVLAAHHDDAICIVHRLFGSYSNTEETQFIKKNYECYCEKFPPCTNFYDEEQYAAGSHVRTPSLLFAPISYNETHVTSYTEQLQRDPHHFGKILSLVKAWSSGICDIIFFTDMDVIFTNFSLDLRTFFQDPSTEMVLSRQPIGGVNAGVYAFQTSHYMALFLLEWWELEKHPAAHLLHGDQGALYEMLLRRATSLKPDVQYNGNCRSESKYISRWSAQTACFNEWMLNLGHGYPDWDKAWQGNHSGIHVVRGPKLQGFPYELYGNRPVSKYEMYRPFDYSHVLDVCAEPEDLMVHFSSAGLSPERQASFQCSAGGWEREAIFPHVEGDRLVYSSHVREVHYAHKKLAKEGQAWLNKDAPKNKVWTLPADWKLPSMGGLPAFVGVGCGHCGSTSFYTTLMQHPQLVPGFRKEVLYLGDHLPDRTIDGYASQFPQVNDWEMTGEFSPYYLSNPSTPQLLQNISPESKVILMLRDPLEQCRSGYGFEAVHKAMIEQPDCNFYHNLKAKNGAREPWNYNPCDIADHYIEGVKRWQYYTDPSKFLMIDSAEFQKYPNEVLRHVQSFLGLPYFDGFGEDGSVSGMHVTKQNKNATLPQASCFDPFQEEVDYLLNPYRIFPKLI